MVRHRLTCLVAALAWFATVGFKMCDMEKALRDAVSTRSGGLTELCPISFTVLWAALVIAGLVLLLTISVSALLATVLGLDGDVECALHLASSRIRITAVGAFLVAFTPFAP